MGLPPLFIGGLRLTYAVSLQLEEATTLLIEIQERSEERYVSPDYEALIYVGLAEKAPAYKDKTIELLEKAYEDRFEWLVHLGVDPAFDWLVGEPRYDALSRGWELRNSIDPVLRAWRRVRGCPCGQIVSGL